MEAQRPHGGEALDLRQMWFRQNADQASAQAAGATYRPAALVECRLGFRSIRASFQHTEERYYTAWYPTRHLGIDWANCAMEIPSPTCLMTTAPAEAKYITGDYDFSPSFFDELQEELIDYLTRTARFSVLYNANFSLYAEPRESRDDFLARVAEAALDRVEPQLKRLMHRFELAIEQLREVQSRRGNKLEGDKAEEVFTRWRDVFALSETRLADMFVSRFRMVLDIPEAHQLGSIAPEDRELMEEMRRLEKEAKTAINDLYGEFIQSIEQCDKFEVGLQRDNIYILRHALLWAPVA